MGTLSLAIVSISISITIGDGTDTRSNHSTASGILPVNAHAEVNILNFSSIDSFIFYSSTNILSNDIHYNYYLRYILLHLLQNFVF